jgi:hypothetical protein
VVVAGEAVTVAGSATLTPGGTSPVRVATKGAYLAPNAMGNFCFDVMLGYRRLERPRRVKNGR